MRLVCTICGKEHEAGKCDIEQYRCCDCDTLFYGIQRMNFETCRKCSDRHSVDNRKNEANRQGEEIKYREFRHGCHGDGVKLTELINRQLADGRINPYGKDLTVHTAWNDLEESEESDDD